MNKVQLIEQVAAKTGMSKKAATEAVEATISIIKETAAKEEVRISGFGTFKSTTRKARVGRNPSNGQPLEIPEKTVVKFKPYF